MSSKQHLDPKQAEAIRRLRWVRNNYKFWRTVFGTQETFNHSLNKLSKVKNSRCEKRSDDNANLEIEFATWFFARRHAHQHGRLKNITPADRDAGRLETIRQIKIRRGRPRDPVLDIHLKLAIAAIREGFGRSVQVTRYRNSVYDPQGANAGGKAVIALFLDLDPSLTVTQLVNAVERLRRNGAGEAPCFLDLAPLYGSTVEPIG